MERHLWNQKLRKHYSPNWPCSTCAKGHLVLVPKSLSYTETVDSKKEHSNAEWEPDWITYVFTAWLKCNNLQCGEEVVVSGTGGEEQDYGPEDEIDWSPQFAPKFCCPMPDIFVIPKKCPKDVRAELRAAFAIFWSDHCSAAARIRIALERLMDFLEITATKIYNTKTIDLTLHQRIEIFQKGDPTIGDQLMALKWLGNTSSHASNVSREDVLDAFEILEHALFELIERRSAKVAKLAQKLAYKHAPAPKPEGT